MAVTHDDRPPGTGRAAGGWGWAFIVLLLLSAGMASVPGGADAVPTVRTFYTAHASVIVAAQVLSLLASGTLVRFVLTLRRRSSEPRTRVGLLEAAGLAVAAASVLTVVPPLWLAAVADTASNNEVHRLAVASDLVDVVLFMTIAVFGCVLAAAASPAWFKGLSVVVAVLALGRAVELLLGSNLLELAAPLAFVALVVVLSTLVLFWRTPISLE